MAGGVEPRIGIAIAPQEIHCPHCGGRTQRGTYCTQCRAVLSLSPWLRAISIPDLIVFFFKCALAGILVATPFVIFGVLIYAASR